MIEQQRSCSGSASSEQGSRVHFLFILSMLTSLCSISYITSRLLDVLACISSLHSYSCCYKLLVMPKIRPGLAALFGNCSQSGVTKHHTARTTPKYTLGF